MTHRISRRGFIRAGAAASLMAASGCGLFSREREYAPPCEASREPPASATVSMVRTGDGLETVSRAIELAGGLDFIQPGQSVMIKPAMNSSNPFPATTDPAVVALVVDLCSSKGASRVVVADKPFFLKSATAVFERSGIGPAARKAGAEVVPLDRVKWAMTRQPEAEHWGGEFRVPAMLSEFDHVIYLPTVRTHILARFTMSLKNSVGLLAPGNCFAMHISPRLQDHIAEINLAVNPSFYLLDGRKVFVEGGPDSGREVETGIVFAGTDPVACDVLGLALLKKLGTREDIQQNSVWNQRMIRRAVELGLGVGKAESIKIVTEGVDEQQDIIENLA